MTSPSYDVLVVGARCAGAPLAMLLARKGYRVCVVDKASFPSDTVSTHLIHPPGVAALRRWGLRDRLVATGCPPIGTYTFDFGPFALSGAPGTREEPVAYAPRRTVLDKLLVDAAAEAGAEVRERFTVTDLVTTDGRVTGVRGRRDGGRPVTAHARVVVGADGRHSRVARAVRPDAYHEKPRLLHSYYSYWQDVPGGEGFETYLRPHRGIAAWPTHDDLTLIIAGWPVAEFTANRTRIRGDVEGHLLEMFELAPAFAERVRQGRRLSRIVGAAVRNYFRTPYGPGWALVGDAGYNKDYITAQGIADAFLDAERCVTALDEALSEARPFTEAMGDYQAARDARALAMYELTTQLATLEPPPPEVQQVLAAAAGNQEAMDGFARVNAGVTSPQEFFSAQNVERIITAADQPAPAATL